MRTNDMVLISFVEVLLREASIDFIILDQNMSVLDGSVGVIPRRILIDEEKESAARSLFSEAGIAHEINTV